MVDCIDFLIILFATTQDCGVCSFELCSGVKWCDLLCFVYTYYNLMWVHNVTFLLLFYYLFICKNNDDNNNLSYHHHRSFVGTTTTATTWAIITIARNYSAEARATTYSCSLGKKNQEEREEGKEREKKKRKRRNSDSKLVTTTHKGRKGEKGKGKKKKKKEKKKGRSLAAQVGATAHSHRAIITSVVPTTITTKLWLG